MNGSCSSCLPNHCALKKSHSRQLMFLHYGMRFFSDVFEVMIKWSYTKEVTEEEIMH